MEQSQERQRQLYQELDKVANSQPAAAPAHSQPPLLRPCCGSQLLDQPGRESGLRRGREHGAQGRTTTRPFPAFEGFIKQFPSSSYVPNAHYWLGQLMFNKGDRAGAASQFTTVANKF